MKNYPVINYHITNRCNYHCTYCFGKFADQKEPSPEEAKNVIGRIKDYFDASGISYGRVNFAGGEPTLCEHLDALIDYANSLGISVSLVTNGSYLTPERIRSWEGKVSCIGISIDSAEPETNRLIGRCCREKTLELPRLYELADAIHGCGIRLKINTVVSKRNLDEDLSPLYRSLYPDKIKLFQVHLIDGINDKAERLAISEKEFNDFVQRHCAFSSVIVAEPCRSMENSYLMINPSGSFQMNDNGKYRTYGNCQTEPLAEILKKVPLAPERFDARYLREAAK